MKKKAIILFADMRTTFDTNFYNEKEVNVSKKFIEFSEKISMVAENEGVDVAILSTVTNHKRHESTLDIEYSVLIEDSWWLSSYIEGYIITKTSEIVTCKNTKLGKSLYKDGYAVLNKEKGFRNYYMDEYNDNTELTQKAINYIHELENEYDIDKIFIIDDQVNTLFDKYEALDDEVLKNALNKQIIKIRPSLPYWAGRSSTTGINNNGDFCIFSGNHTIDGVNEGLDIYLNVLKEQISNKSEKIKKL